MPSDGHGHRSPILEWAPLELVLHDVAINEVSPSQIAFGLFDGLPQFEALPGESRSDHAHSPEAAGLDHYPPYASWRAWRGRNLRGEQHEP